MNQQDHHDHQNAVGSQAGAQQGFGHKLLTAVDDVKAHKNAGAEHDPAYIQHLKYQNVFNFLCFFKGRN
ncbi:MAG: hypothetical protein GY850_22665 [bacterium]|nr:hypothetical protein [bacterium]